MKPRDAGGFTRLARGVASAPLTFVWLFVLLVTTPVQRSAGRLGSRRIQRSNSTNLRRLRTEPSRVLATSLFWLDGRKWWPYVPVFVGVVAPAERRLHWWRWLLVGVVAHVIATYMRYPSSARPGVGGLSSLPASKRQCR
jgi:hypothetical protein